MRKTLTLLAALIGFSAQADEQWQSNYGEVIYEMDYGDLAVLSFPGGHPGHRVNIYVKGLGGNYDRRAFFPGYWIAPEQGDCLSEIRGEDGLETNTWGSATIHFDNPGFPSPFTAQLSNCFGEAMEELRAIPQVASAPPQSGPTGLYSDTDFGPINFFCESAVRCRGTYEDGQSFLFLESHGPNGDFRGIWAEPQASRSCHYSKELLNISTAFWGHVQIQFDAEAEAWTGSWGYCDDPPAAIFNGNRGQASSQPPKPVGGDASTIGRFLGSWLPTPGSDARRNDMYTFNPDGTRAISDGSGMNLEDTWAFTDGRLTIDNRPVDLSLAGDTLILSGAEMERATLWGEEYAGRHVDPGVDSYGVFAPREAIKVGAYTLNLILLGSSEEFQEHAKDPAALLSPILVEFWNEAAPLKMAENGNAYRDDTVRFEPDVYEITAERLKFYGQHPRWGEIFFNGRFEGAASDIAMTGDLMVKGFLFRDVGFARESLH